MGERYLVVVDGTTVTSSSVPRGEALGVALAFVDGCAAVDVAVVDARTYEMRARWSRWGLQCAVTAADGWLQ